LLSAARGRVALQLDSGSETPDRRIEALGAEAFQTDEGRSSPLDLVVQDWKSALFLVTPETVISWHRKEFRTFWTWKSRKHQCERLVSKETRS
jgi:hypothetical protein